MRTRWWERGDVERWRRWEREQRDWRQWWRREREWRRGGHGERWCGGARFLDEFFLDGVEHPSLSTTPTTKHGGNPDKPFYLPEVNAIWFGWAEYQPTTQEFELWFDEIAIDPERIGCVL
jgi:hypothetical protein